MFDGTTPTHIKLLYPILSTFPILWPVSPAFLAIYAMPAVGERLELQLGGVFGGRQLVLRPGQLPGPLRWKPLPTAALPLQRERAMLDVQQGEW